MMKKLVLFILLLALNPIAMSEAIVSEQSCSGTINAYDSTFCWAKLLINSDKELNQVYKTVRKSLSQEEQEQLKIAQFSWLDYRDRNCSGKNGNEGTIDLYCATNLNLERVKLFKSYLNSCENEGCNKETLFNHF